MMSKQIFFVIIFYCINIKFIFLFTIIYKEFIDADEANKIIRQETSFETTSHSEAIYTSRFMKFNNLSKPINTTRVQTEDSEGIIKFIIVILLNF